MLAPRLGGQGVVRRGRFVPAAAFCDVVEAAGDARRELLFGLEVLVLVNVACDAVAHRLIEVAVGVVLQ